MNVTGLKRQMNFRNDIQILRGISVVLVVLYHLEIPGVKSGFLGVDVFFVISGFLMAVLYDYKDKTGFFIKRAKRLLPAYFVTVIATLIAAFILVTPNEFIQVSKQALFASFFSSNIGFWLENSYFSKTAFNPLLHLWSLGVEIQFYIFVPVLFWFFRKSNFILPIVIISSLLLCLAMIDFSAKTSFFMMPLRLWEFLLGYFVAIHCTDRGSILYTNKSLIGVISAVVLVLIPFMNVDGQAENILAGHPALFAVLVCIATAGTLAFGLPNVINNSLIGRLLERAGKYSYSVYLVHFPLIVVFLYEPFSGTILHVEKSSDTLILLSLIVALSLAMYHFVEVPFRKSVKRSLYLAMWISVGVLALLLPDFQRHEFSLKENRIFDAWTDRGRFRCGKLARLVSRADISCKISREIDTPIRRIFFVGNSHADSIKESFVSVANERETEVYFVVFNNPLMVGGLTPETIVDEAVHLQADSITLHYSPHSIPSDNILKLVSIASKYEIAVSLIMPVPVWKTPIPKAMYQHLKSAQPLPEKTYQEYLAETRSKLEELVDFKASNFKKYEVGTTLCNPLCQYMDSAGKPYYFDGGHFTLTGAKQLKGVFAKVIEDAPKIKE